MKEDATNLAEQFESDAAEPSAPPGDTAGLMVMAEEFESLKELVHEQAEELKENRRRLDELCKELIPSAMERAGLVSAAGKGAFTLKSGAKIHLRGDLYAGYKKMNEADVFVWLRDNGHGDIIKETINNATLRAFAKEQLENNVALPSTLFDVSPYTKATLRKK